MTRRAVVLLLMDVLVLVGVPFLGACGGDEKDGADTSAAPTTAPRGEPIVIHEKLIIAATEHSEPIATGTILAGSTLGGRPFCARGAILDSHASLDPKVEPYLIDRMIMCPDGTVRIGFTPEVGAERQAQTQRGSWTIVSGTGAFEGARRKREERGRVRPNPDTPVRETLTGTVTR